MQRENNLKNWVSSVYPGQAFEMRFAASDADHRKYYRATFEDQTSIILMDAPPEKFNIEPYIRVQQLFQAVQVSQIYHINQEEGFIALQDFGDNSFIKLMLEINDLEVHKSLLLKAISSLIALQKSSQENTLPFYSEEQLDQEMNLFVEWCIPKYYHLQLSHQQHQRWQQAKKILISEIMTHANVYVHRDYIIRNLMLLPDQTVGIIDFQDAVLGSIYYDLVSLTKDAFITWNEEVILDLVIRYWEQAKKAKLPVNPSFDDFYRSYEWVGVQRHLKVAGIFTRLKYRDHKDRYINEVPRFIQYLKKTTRRYSELHPLYQLIVELTGTDQELQQGYTF